MKSFNLSLLLVLISLILYSFIWLIDLPKDWIKAGNKPDSYTMGLDTSVYKSGIKSVFIESKENKIEGFGTVMQICDAQNYLGKKIKMTGYIKTENVSDWSGMWLRIDPKLGKNPLGFDNMQSRSLKGTMDWTKCEIVLDVPNSSATLNYGALISGTGKIWFDYVSIEIIGESSADETRKKLLTEPSNIDFEELGFDEIQGEEIDWKNLEWFHADNLKFESDKINMNIVDADFIEIKSKSGISGIYVRGNGTVEILKEKFSDKIDGCIIRFNPADMNKFITIKNKEKLADVKFKSMSEAVLENSFKHCYHNKMNAFIPAENDFALNLFTKNSGEILASYSKDKNIIFNFTEKKEMFK